MSERKGSAGDGLIILWLFSLGLYCFTHGYALQFLAGSGIGVSAMLLVEKMRRRKERGK